MSDQSFTSKQTNQPIGLIALIEKLDLSVRRPAVRSWTRSAARKTIITSEAIKEYYPPIYKPSGIIGNLKFALRYEPIDLIVYDALFKILDARLLEEWIGQEPKGTYARRAWFLYEALTGKLLDADDISPTG